MLRKLLKILLIIISSIIGLVVLLFILVWLGMLNGIIVNTIEKQAAKNLTGELTIGSLKGTLLSDFSITDITITTESDTVLYTGEIQIDYDLFPLLRKEIRLNRVLIRNVEASLIQDNDSVWNFMKLMKEKSPEPDTSSTEFTWKILVNEFTFERFSADISSIDTSGMIPEHIEAGLKIRATYSGDTIIARLDSLKIITLGPDFQIADLSGRFSKQGDLLKWDDVELHLENSFLLSEGSYSPVSNGQVDAEIDIMPFSFDDLKTFLPDLQFYGTPDIKISLIGDKSEYQLTGNIDEDEQNISFSGSLTDLTTNPGYFLRLNMSNLDGSHWTGNDKIKTSISGNLEIEGTGFQPENNDMRLKAGFGNIRYNEYSLNNLIINAEKKKDFIAGNLSSSTFAGDISLRFDLSDVFGVPLYDLLLNYRNVDIGNLTGIDSVSSDLNGKLQISGRGIEPGSLVTSVVMKSDSSTVAGEPLGDFMLEADYEQGIYDFRLAGFGLPYFILDAEGSGDIEDTSLINFSFEPVDPGRLAQIFGMPSLSASGRITGRISGKPDALTVNSEIELDSIVYDTIMITGIRSEAAINMVDKILSGRLQLNSGKITAGSLSLQSAEIEGKYSANNIEAGINLVVTDSLQASFLGSVEGFENPLIRIKHLGINYTDSEWSTPGDSAYIRLNEEAVTINGFTLSSGDQSISVNGQFAFRGSEDISAEISNLQLQSLPLDEFLPYEVTGGLSLNVEMKGTAEQPVLNSRIWMDEVDVNGLIIDSIRTRVSYENDLLKVSGNITSGLYESVELLLDVPVHLTFTDSIQPLKEDNRFAGSLYIDSLDLKEISGFFPVKNMSAEGFADVNVEVGNTMNDPLIAGSIGLRDGRFINTQYGAEYDDIQFFASIDSSTVGLDTLSLKTKKGYLALSGYVSLQNTDSMELNDLSLRLKSDNFQAVESQGIELNFDSDLDISGTLGKPGFKGGLSINSSKINIDYFNEFFSQKTDEPDLPLLIQAIRDTVQISENADTTESPGFSGTAFYKSLEGEALVEIPGNTWITGKDMNFELNGSVRAVKASEDIRLFGELNIRRGYYKIYGRNFDFERGKITFTGAAGFNPDVDFEIIYSFRDIEKELRDLKLLITGKLMQPDLNFMLDDEAVEEKDAISYIVFGKSVNELGDGERDKLSGQDIAMGAAVTQLSSVLKGVLQESAGVDVFEVTGGEDWKSGSVTIGKYITNNLFLSYDRSFDFNKQSKTANTERIMLEYQLFRRLLLKATNQEVNSGFDLIWRKTWR